MGMVKDELGKGQRNRRETTGLGCYSQYTFCPVLVLLNNHCHTLDGSTIHLTTQEERFNKPGSTTDYTEWPLL